MVKTRSMKTAVALMCGAVMCFPGTAPANEPRFGSVEHDVRVTVDRPEVKGGSLTFSGQVLGTVSSGMVVLRHRQEGRWRPVAVSDFRDRNYTIGYANVGGRYRVTMSDSTGQSPVASPVIEVEATERAEPLEWVVALGDSYMSGEGASYAGYGPKKGNNHPWYQSSDEWWVSAFGSGLEQTYPGDYSTQPLAQPALAHLGDLERESYSIRVTGELCHRSRSALMYWNKPDHPAMNLACSSAVADTNPQRGKPGIDFYDRGNLQGQALMLQNFAKKVRAKGDTVKYVLLSIGGNDIGFSSIVKDCLKRYLSPGLACSRRNSGSEAQQAYDSGRGLKPAQRAVAQAGRNIVEALRREGIQPGSYTIAVQTYPMAVPPSDEFEKDFGGNSGGGRQGIGGCGFTDSDLDFFNGDFGKLLRQRIIEGADEITYRNPGVKVVVVDASRSVDGHQLCSKQVDYPKRDSWGTNSMTPDWNEKGVGATGSWITPVIVGCIGKDNAVTCGESDNPATLYPRLWEAVGGAGDFRSQRWDAAITELKQLPVHPNYWGQRALATCHEQALSDAAAVGKVVECVPRAGSLNKFGRPQMKTVVD